MRRNAQGSSDLTTGIRKTLTTEKRKNLPAVLFHRVQDCLGLETCSLQGSPGNVSSLSMLCDSENRTLRIVDPVWSKQTAESSNKYASTVVRHRSCKVRNLMALVNKPQIVHQELYSAPCNGDAAFKSIHWFGVVAKLICDSCQQTLSSFETCLDKIVEL
jgi:hypothetical protein